MQYKLKHRLSAALMAGAMCCTMIPAASADEIATPETADTAVPEVTDSAAPDISQITENLYNDLPDAPTGSYLGSMGLPVATGETKISISAWVSDLYDGADAHIDADALNEDETTITIGKNLNANYAIIPLLVQTEYPANGATAEVVLPEGVEVLSYASTDADLIPAGDAEQSKILYQTYVEQSAAATGFYVKAFSDFTAQFVYASPDGTTLQKSMRRLARPVGAMSANFPFGCRFLNTSIMAFNTVVLPVPGEPVIIVSPCWNAVRTACSCFWESVMPRLSRTDSSEDSMFSATLI